MRNMIYLKVGPYMCKRLVKIMKNANMKTTTKKFALKIITMTLLYCWKTNAHCLNTIVIKQAVSRQYHS